MTKVLTRDIEQHSTPEGLMIPIYKDWESWFEGYVPKMAYVTTIAPQLAKGPILHHRRRGLLTCISGEATLEVLESGQIRAITLRAADGKMTLALVPAGVPVRLKNIGTTEAVILNLPDRAWHPEDPDTKKYSDWSEVQHESARQS